MIEVKNLSRHYGNTIAVSDVSFHIGKNEIVGLLGHNGAGKTTIMKMLSGYLEPTSGTVHIAGIDMKRDARTVQQQLGYLPENLPVYPDMLVADYLEYAATLKGIAKSERMAAVRDAIVATDLNERSLAKINTLSRGLRQRVGVAQAILGQPRLLILDEPTNGLDPQQTDLMRALIKRLAQRATIILSTHIMQEVDAVCDRVLMLRNGQLVLDERQEVLKRSRTLSLKTSPAIDLMENVLRRLPQVANLSIEEDTAEFTRYLLTLHEGVESDTAANNIAQCVLKAGGKLYVLQPLVKDLDRIFRDANLARGHLNEH